MPETKPRPILFFRVEPQTYQKLCNLLVAIDTILELPKINHMIRELEAATKAVSAPDETLGGHLKDAPPDDPPNKGKKNGNGKDKDGLEPAGKEH